MTATQQEHGTATGLSWKPVRRGDTYCAPACGGRCALKQWAQAKLDAEKSRDRLARVEGTTGWTARLTHNLGWFGSAVLVTTTYKIDVSIYRYGPVVSYGAIIGLPGKTGGYWTGSGATPEQAVDEARKQAREELAFLDAKAKAARDVQKEKTR